jgi:hypothetical protein
MPASSGVPGPAIKSFLAGAGELDRLEIKNIGLEKQFWMPPSSGVRIATYTKLPKLFPQFPQPELLEQKVKLVEQKIRSRLFS